MVPTGAAITTVVLDDVTVLAEGLSFPEDRWPAPTAACWSPRSRPGRVTRVTADGQMDMVATCGGGPNGSAIGPDGALYVCNNGGRFADGHWKGGWVERVDLATGTVDVLYSHDGDRRLSGPNDIVFDGTGAFWFTDTGKFQGRQRDVGSVYNATIDGSRLDEVVFPAESPNGIGISPDGGTLYYAETVTARLRARRIIGPGELAPQEGHGVDSVICTLPGLQGFDSLAVDAAGNVCIATLVTGGITSDRPRWGDGDPVPPAVGSRGPHDHQPVLWWSGAGNGLHHPRHHRSPGLLSLAWARPRAGLQLLNQPGRGGLPSARRSTEASG